MQYDIGTPFGKVARTPEEAEAIAKELGTMRMFGIRRLLLIHFRRTGWR